MGRRPAVIACLALAAAASLAHAASGPADADVAARVDAIFAPFAVPDAPGCAVGIVKDGTLVLARAYGMADLEHAVPLTPASAFQLASESKAFTAAAVLLAEGQGALSLDDDVRRYVPELPDYGTTITLRHLLHHTSGVRDYATLWSLMGDLDVYPRTVEGALALLVDQRELNFVPGRDVCYSNSGYLLLGIALERATGTSLGTFMATHLFEPLGMSSTRLVNDRFALIPDRAVGHVRLPGGGYGRVASTSEIVGARGIVSTVEDLARWERVFHTGALGGELLAGLLTRGRLADGTVLPYAAGLVLEDDGGLLAVSHGGEGDGSSTFLLRFPEIRLSVICLCNCAGSGAAGLAWRTAASLMAGPYREATLAHRHPAPPPVFVTLTEDSLGVFAGAYRDTRTRAVWRITVREGGLVLDAGRGRSVLRPLADGTFRSAGPGQILRASFDAEGMRFDVEGRPPSTFERVELVAPETAPLDEYAGEYRSEDLPVPWTLAVRDGRLRFVGAGAPDEPLEPTVRDELALGDALRVSFRRDAHGRVVGMSAHTDRVWNLAFERVQ